MLSSHSDIRSLQHALLQGNLCVTDVVKHYLQKIRDTAHLNQYIEVYTDEALAKAIEIDQKIKSKASLGKLFGMVLSHKDVISLNNHALSASSNVLKGYNAKYSATVLERIVQEDAIVIGRVNCDEFAMGSSNENSAYGPVKNPIDESRIPGGSSGACATSVASDTCWASIGTDTGGSVRQPAAFCGIIGFKPSYGAISRHGLIAYASSFDQAGFLTKSVYDAALLLEITAGQDDFDASMNPEFSYSSGDLSSESTKASIAYLDLFHFKNSIQPDIYTNYYQTLDAWKSQGFKLEAVSMDWLDYIIPAYYVMTTAEASSNLSRFDGVRYGHRAHAATLEKVYKQSRTEGFGKEVKRRILLGTYVLSAGFYDAYYTKAQKVRRLVKNNLNKVFESHAGLILPVSPVMPWKIGEKLDDPVSVYLADIFTVLANVAGVPGIALPVQKNINTLPIGIQLLAASGKDAQLLNMANVLSSY